MISAISTFYFYPSLPKTDLQIQASAITTPSTNRTIPRHRSSNDNGSSSRLVRRRISKHTAEEAVSAAIELESAANVVREFYDGINRRDLASVEDLFALNCVYEDFIFYQPFVGRKAILDYFKRLIYSMGTDLQFAIDDLSEGDNTAIGVNWHCEWKGKPFPFTKGCSFYRLEIIDGQRQIVSGRDAVEPVIKPGEATLGAIRLLTWLLHNFPFLADRL